MAPKKSATSASVQSIPTSFEDAKSTTLSHASYDPTTQILIIRFVHQDARYAYADVPLLVWEAFVKATSRGQFFHQRIRPVFHGKRM